MFSIREDEIAYLAAILGDNGNNEMVYAYASMLLECHDDNLAKLDGMILTPLDQVFS